MGHVFREKDVVFCGSPFYLFILVRDQMVVNILKRTAVTGTTVVDFLLTFHCEIFLVHDTTGGRICTIMSNESNYE